MSAEGGAMNSKLGTAFDLLELFERPTIVRLTVAEAAARIGMSKSTISTTLAALAEERYLARDDSGLQPAYVMGSRLRESFANALLRSALELRDRERETRLYVEQLVGPLAELGRMLLDDGAHDTADRSPSPTDDRPSARRAIDQQFAAE